ncbi:hypothetical protein BGX28_004340 [Mortierella sp. GBA30]|nr:hypothetical protein BGX28_004340 [Mortierella sp. GBA30]
MFSIGSLKFRGAAGIVTTNNAELPPTVDGIMGLWYYAAGSSIPILNVLKNTTSLAQNMIGIYLKHSSNTEAGTAPGGEVTFGGINPARFSGQITYVNCVGKRPWTIPVTAITVGGSKINIRNSMANMDTGTTAMLLPQAISDAINQVIPGATRAVNQGGLWFIPCSGNTPISMTFGSFTANIPYTDLAMQSSRQSTSRGDYCLSAAMFPTGQTAVIQEWLIGDVFLKNVYTVFDFGTNSETGGRIGFASLGSGGNIGTGNGAGSLRIKNIMVVRSPLWLLLVLTSVLVAVL